jgi:hypothetical protein
MKNLLARLLLVAPAVLLICLQTTQGQRCQNLVHYDRKTASLTFNGYGIGQLSAGLDAKTLQVASNLTQIFDQYQRETCDLLNRNRNAPNHQENVQNSLEATARLATLMALLQKDKATDKDIGAVIDSLAKGKELQQKVTDSRTKEIPLEANIAAADPEFVEYLTSLRAPATGSCTWDLFSEEQKKDIRNKLVTAPALLAQPLNISPNKLGTFLFLPCSDGRLHVATSYFGVDPPSRRETVKIHENYGFVGIAFATLRTQSGVIPEAGFPGPSFVMGTDTPAAQSQEAARRVLLEPEEMKKINAKWVIAVPLKGQNRKVYGVISFSSEENPSTNLSATDNTANVKAIEQLLDKLANGSDIERLSEELASLLTSGK